MNADASEKILASLNNLGQENEVQHNLLTEIKQSDVSAEILTTLHDLGQKNEENHNILAEIKESDVSAEILTTLHELGHKNDVQHNLLTEIKEDKVGVEILTTLHDLGQKNEAQHSIMTKIKESDVSAQILTTLHDLERQNEIQRNLIIEIREADICAEILSTLHDLEQQNKVHHTILSDVQQADVSEEILTILHEIIDKYEVQQNLLADIKQTDITTDILSTLRDLEQQNKTQHNILAEIKGSNVCADILTKLHDLEYKNEAQHKLLIDIKKTSFTEDILTRLDDLRLKNEVQHNILKDIMHGNNSVEILATLSNIREINKNQYEITSKVCDQKNIADILDLLNDLRHKNLAQHKLLSEFQQLDSSTKNDKIVGEVYSIKKLLQDIELKMSKSDVLLLELNLKLQESNLLTKDISRYFNNDISRKLNHSGQTDSIFPAENTTNLVKTTGNVEISKKEPLKPLDMLSDYKNQLKAKDSLPFEVDFNFDRDDIPLINSQTMEQGNEDYNPIKKPREVEMTSNPKEDMLKEVINIIDLAKEIVYQDETLKLDNEDKKVLTKSNMSLGTANIIQPVDSNIITNEPSYYESSIHDVTECKEIHKAISNQLYPSSEHHDKINVSKEKEGEEKVDQEILKDNSVKDVNLKKLDNLSGPVKGIEPKKIEKIGEKDDVDEEIVDIEIEKEGVVSKVEFAKSIMKDHEQEKRMLKQVEVKKKGEDDNGAKIAKLVEEINLERHDNSSAPIEDMTTGPEQKETIAEKNEIEEEVEEEIKEDVGEDVGKDVGEDVGENEVEEVEKEIKEDVEKDVEEEVVVEDMQIEKEEAVSETELVDANTTNVVQEENTLELVEAEEKEEYAEAKVIESVFEVNPEKPEDLSAPLEIITTKDQNGEVICEKYEVGVDEGVDEVVEGEVEKEVEVEEEVDVEDVQIEKEEAVSECEVVEANATNVVQEEISPELTEAQEKEEYAVAKEIELVFEVNPEKLEDLSAPLEEIQSNQEENVVEKNEVEVLHIEKEEAISRTELVEVNATNVVQEESTLEMVETEEKEDVEETIIVESVEKITPERQDNSSADMEEITTKNQNKEVICEKIEEGVDDEVDDELDDEIEVVDVDVQIEKEGAVSETEFVEANTTIVVQEENTLKLIEAKKKEDNKEANIVETMEDVTPERQDNSSAVMVETISDNQLEVVIVEKEEVEGEVVDVDVQIEKEEAVSETELVDANATNVVQEESNLELTETEEKEDDKEANIIESVAEVISETQNSSSVPIEKITTGPEQEDKIFEEEVEEVEEEVGVEIHLMEAIAKDHEQEERNVNKEKVVEEKVEEETLKENSEEDVILGELVNLYGLVKEVEPKKVEKIDEKDDVEEGVLDVDVDVDVDVEIEKEVISEEEVKKSELVEDFKLENQDVIYHLGENIPIALEHKETIVEEKATEVVAIDSKFVEKAVEEETNKEIELKICLDNEENEVELKELDTKIPIRDRIDELLVMRADLELKSEVDLKTELNDCQHLEANMLDLTREAEIGDKEKRVTALDKTEPEIGLASESERKVNSEEKDNRAEPEESFSLDSYRDDKNEQDDDRLYFDSESLTSMKINENISAVDSDAVSYHTTVSEIGKAKPLNDPSDKLEKEEDDVDVDVEEMNREELELNFDIEKDGKDSRYAEEATIYPHREESKEIKQNVVEEEGDRAQLDLDSETTKVDQYLVLEKQTGSVNEEDEKSESDSVIIPYKISESSKTSQVPIKVLDQGNACLSNTSLITDALKQSDDLLQLQVSEALLEKNENLLESNSDSIFQSQNDTQESFNEPTSNQSVVDEIENLEKTYSDLTVEIFNTRYSPRDEEISPKSLPSLTPILSETSKLPSLYEDPLSFSKADLDLSEPGSKEEAENLIGEYEPACDHNPGETIIRQKPSPSSTNEKTFEEITHLTSCTRSIDLDLQKANESSTANSIEEISKAPIIFENTLEITDKNQIGGGSEEVLVMNSESESVEDLQVKKSRLVTKDDPETKIVKGALGKGIEPGRPVFSRRRSEKFEELLKKFEGDSVE
ncbi:hypothetical protein OnM2_040036 [Erysiphe neolycopersici]|uniref:Uncharacterized protein n=1 Tax=Erysiphe neolycopersici TaxID=212602 RepID=A0A420HVZ0_9PEZI|nr:hypothetical protein OnM2_040036 [Erysiphe neolycopersici]